MKRCVSQRSGFCFPVVGVLFPSGRGFHYKMMFLGGFPSGRGFVSQWSGFCFPVVGVLFPSGRGFVSQRSGFCFPVVGVFIIK